MWRRLAGVCLITLVVSFNPSAGSPTWAESSDGGLPAAQEASAPPESLPDAEPVSGPTVTAATDADPTIPPESLPDAVQGSEPTVTEATVGDSSIPPTSDTVAQPDDGTEIQEADPVVGARPGAQPRVSNSNVSSGSIVLAMLVLAGVGLTAGMLSRRQRTVDTSVPVGVPQRRVPLRELDDGAEGRARRGGATETATLDFLLGLGELLVDAGDAVNHVETTLRVVARVNGLSDVGVVVLPTALVVSVPGSGDVTTAVGTAGRSPLRLDQIDDALELVQEAEEGSVGPVEGSRRVASIRGSAPPFSPRLALAGYVCSTAGLAMILRATWREVVLAAALGVLVGLLRLSTKRLGPAYQPFVTLIGATGVSITVFVLARISTDLAVFPLLVSPLITFLPGALLTIGVLELAVGQIVSGASRLASGAMQLVVMALGIVAGGQLVGVPAGDLRGNVGGAYGVLAPWVGVAAFGIGIVWFHGARPHSRLWILLVLYVAYAGQVIGGLFFGGALSAFFGALAMTPVAIVAARQRSGPTPLVTFLPGFWILVPGALGLEGVARLFGDDGGVGTGVLVTAFASMVGISLGILLGLIVAADDPEHPWVDAVDIDGAASSPPSPQRSTPG